MAGRPKNKYFDYLSDDPDYIDPRNIMKALKQQSTDLIKIFAKRRWIVILNKMDTHRYFFYRVTISNPEEQLWVAGDRIVVNQNPNKDILIRSFCMKTKKWCCGFEGDISSEFFSVCPHCKHVYVGVRDSVVPCDWCNKDIDCSEVTKWVKYSCINCPANIGLDDANKHLNYAYENQFLRKPTGMEQKESENDTVSN